MHRDAAHRAESLGCRVRAMDFSEVRRPRLQPIEARPLGVVVHDGGGDVVAGEIAGEIGGDRGFASSTLAVDHQRGVHARGFTPPFFVSPAAAIMRPTYRESK